MTPNRRERLREATYDEIKSVAWRHIAESGPAALSLRAIARDMGMSAPALYRYYESRDALVTALIIEAFTSFGTALSQARDTRPADDHAGRFRAIGRAYRDWAAANPSRFLLIFGTPAPGYSCTPDPAFAPLQSFFVLSGVLDAAYYAGALQLPPDYIHLTPTIEARVTQLCGQGVEFHPVALYLGLEAWAKVHGLTALELYGHFPTFLGEALEDFLNAELDAYTRTLFGAR